MNPAVVQAFHRLGGEVVMQPVHVAVVVSTGETFRRRRTPPFSSMQKTTGLAGNGLAAK